MSKIATDPSNRYLSIVIPKEKDHVIFQYPPELHWIHNLKCHMPFIPLINLKRKPRLLKPQLMTTHQQRHLVLSYELFVLSTLGDTSYLAPYVNITTNKRWGEWVYGNGQISRKQLPAHTHSLKIGFPQALHERTTANLHQFNKSFHWNSLRIRKCNQIFSLRHQTVTVAFIQHISVLYELDQVWCILPASELLPLDWSQPDRNG